MCNGIGLAGSGTTSTAQVNKCNICRLWIYDKMYRASYTWQQLCVAVFVCVKEGKRKRAREGGKVDLMERGARVIHLQPEYNAELSCPMSPLAQGEKKKSQLWNYSICLFFLHLLFTTWGCASWITYFLRCVWMTNSIHAHTFCLIVLHQLWFRMPSFFCWSSLNNRRLFINQQQKKKYAVARQTGTNKRLMLILYSYAKSAKHLSINICSCPCC